MFRISDVYVYTKDGRSQRTDNWILLSKYCTDERTVINVPKLQLKIVEFTDVICDFHSSQEREEGHHVGHHADVEAILIRRLLEPEFTLGAVTRLCVLATNFGNL